jgi:chromosome segregation ATPase
MNRSGQDSPLVTAVLALENYLSELERIGGKINSIDMTSDVDVEHIQKLLMRFAECGQGISEEVRNLSLQLQQAQARAENVAERVSRQADVFKVRRNEQNQHLERFRALGERVRELNATLTRGDQQATPDVPVLEEQLAGLIRELDDLRDSARTSGLKTLEKTAESLTQSLQALQVKLQRLGL